MTNPIPAELRPVLIERVRQLNAEGRFDPEIGRVLGYSSKTIMGLRREGGIGPVNRATRPELWNKDSVACPACRLVVDVRRNIIDRHNLLTGRECPASLCRFDALSAAIEERRARLQLAGAA